MLRALKWPASKKRQGTKSWEVVHRSGSERYGDLNFTPAAMVCGMPIPTRPKCLREESGKAAAAFWLVLGAQQRTVSALIDVVVAREIAASLGPARRSAKTGTLTEGLGHDVSKLFGVGRHLGSQPRAKTSMTIMRSATARTRARQHTWRVRRDVRLLLLVDGGRCDPEQCAGRCDALGAVCAGKEPVVTDAVEALWQHVQQEAPDELVRMKGRSGLERSDFVP